MNDNSVFNQSVDDAQILKHFDIMPSFKKARESWSVNPDDTTAQFCRIARAVNDAGLDWYYINTGPQLRIGRHEQGTRDAIAVFAGLRYRSQQIIIRNPIGSMPKDSKELSGPLTEKLANKIIDALKN